MQYLSPRLNTGPTLSWTNYNRVVWHVLLHFVWICVLFSWGVQFPAVADVTSGDVTSEWRHTRVRSSSLSAGLIHQPWPFTAGSTPSPGSQVPPSALAGRLLVGLLVVHASRDVITLLPPRDQFRWRHRRCRQGRQVNNQRPDRHGRLRRSVHFCVVLLIICNRGSLRCFQSDRNATNWNWSEIARYVAIHCPHQQTIIGPVGCFATSRHATAPISYTKPSPRSS